MEAVRVTREQAATVLVNAFGEVKDLLHLVEYRLQACGELEAVGQSLAALRVATDKLDTLLHHAHSL